MAISPVTVSGWVALGWSEGAPEDARQFAIDYLTAYEDSTNTLVQHIRDSADEDWKAAAWLLERTRPEYMRVVRTTPVDKLKLDAIAIEKATADLALTEAKTVALTKAILDPDEVLTILKAPKLVGHDGQ